MEKIEKGNPLTQSTESSTAPEYMNSEKYFLNNSSNYQLIYLPLQYLKIHEMNKQELPLGMIVGRMMHEMFRVLKKRTGEIAEIKLTIEQFGLLHAINMKNEDVIQQDMADIMGKDKSAIYRVIDSLEEKELVRRVVDKNDRRKNFLMVTKKGEAVIEQYLEIEYKLIKELKEGLCKSDIDTFYSVVNHIRNKAEKF